MRLKNSVEFKNIQPAIWYAIGVAEAIYKSKGYACVVTSLSDGQHIPDSFHYKGLAVDFRTRDIIKTFQLAIAEAIYFILDPLGYDVILEKDHIHVEYDPKGQENWIHRVD